MVRNGRYGTVRVAYRTVRTVACRVACYTLRAMQAVTLPWVVMRATDACIRFRAGEYRMCGLTKRGPWRCCPTLP